MVVSKGEHGLAQVLTGSCPQAPQEKIGWWRGGEMEARNLGGGDLRQEIMEAGRVELGLHLEGGAIRRSWQVRCGVRVESRPTPGFVDKHQEDGEVVEGRLGAPGARMCVSCL